MILHVGLIHLVINLVTQLAIGWSLEKKYGFWRIIPIYFLSGVFGNILSTLFLPQTISVGASSSIFGFVGVLFVDLVQNWKVLRSPWMNLIALLATTLVSFVIGLAPYIDNFAHIGGFIEGLITAVIFLPNMYFWSRTARRAKLISVFIAAPLAVLTLVGGCVLIFNNVNADGWCSWCIYLSCVPLFNWECSHTSQSNATYVTYC